MSSLIEHTTRQFEDRPAVRSQVPLLVGLFGPSSSGKTYSALRLATGIAKVAGGEIFVIDTEAKRSLHYAEHFKFRHVPFNAPFGSLDYLDALQYCAGKNAGCIVIDSMSHEHEGPGGYLRTQEAEVKRMAGQDKNKQRKVGFGAWGLPVELRKRLIDGILHLNTNFIFCFRAKEKLKPVTGDDPIELGMMPIAGEDFMYEMTIAALLEHGSNGVPNWNPTGAGARKMIKLPQQFRDLFKGQPFSLDEATGEALAKWAKGGAAPEPPRTFEAAPEAPRRAADVPPAPASEMTRPTKTFGEVMEEICDEEGMAGLLEARRIAEEKGHKRRLEIIDTNWIEYEARARAADAKRGTVEPETALPEI